MAEKKRTGVLHKVAALARMSFHEVNRVKIFSIQEDHSRNKSKGLLVTRFGIPPRGAAAGKPIKKKNGQIKKIPQNEENP